MPDVVPKLFEFQTLPVPASRASNSAFACAWLFTSTFAEQSKNASNPTVPLPFAVLASYRLPDEPAIWKPPLVLFDATLP
jgi:hypothetical protein